MEHDRLIYKLCLLPRLPIPPQRFRTLPKWSVFYVPGLGQLLWSLECPFLSRNYAKDKGNITKFSKIWETYPFPILVSWSVLGTGLYEQV